MIGWHEARQVAFDTGAAVPRQFDSLTLAQALGRTLAADLRALAALPGHDSSAMDGWAVAGEPPWLIEHAVFAGDTPSLVALSPGRARPIATGAPVPPGAHGILRSERGAVTDGEHSWLDRNESARVDEPRNGEHVRRAGEEVSSGDLLVAAGLVLTPPRAALAAAAGVDHVAVTAAPLTRLAILGTEIDHDRIAQPGRVRDVYAPQLPSVLGSMGLGAGPVLHSPDDIDSTTLALSPGDCTLVVSTGGSSRGPADHVRAALERLDATLVIDGVEVRPGHPIMLAALPGARLVLALPGNPLAAMLGLVGIGQALVDGLLGRPLGALGRIRLAADEPQRGTHTRLLAARVTSDGALPTEYQGSGMLRGLAAADVVVVIPPGGAVAGTVVETIPLPW